MGAVTIVTILKLLGYVNTGWKFFDNIQGLFLSEFDDATALIRTVHEVVVYMPEKTLLGRIDVKYRRLEQYIDNIDNINDQTLLSFKNEILYGDGSVHNAIERFHKSVYEDGGYFDVKQNYILTKLYGGWPVRHTDAFKADEKLRKFFPGLLEVEMQAHSLINFGFFLERLFSKDSLFLYTIFKIICNFSFADQDFSLFETEFQLARQNHHDRLAVVKSKIEGALNEVEKMHQKVIARNRRLFSNLPTDQWRK